MAFFGGLLLSTLPWASAGAQTQPLQVIYGPEASTEEGDYDYREVIFLRLPADATERFYLRVFDPDIGGAHDLIYVSEDTQTRFRLFGGEGAYTAPTVTEPVPSEEDLHAGVLIEEVVLGFDPARDDAWITIAEFAADQGEKVGEHVLFKLTIEGMSGDDANLFDVAVSRRPNRNLAPSGLEMFAFSPSVRVVSKRSVTELRFIPDADTKEITVHNFDAANGQIDVSTALRSTRVAASGQNEWREGRVEIEEAERGQVAAIVFGGGDEIPNDATFYIKDQDGRALPILLPVRSLRRNQRPLVSAVVAPLANCSSFAFDGSRSSDPDGDEISFAWNFGDGQQASGPTVVHRYADPGSYEVVLRVTDSSGQPGNSAAMTLPVTVSRLPSAVAGSDRTVAPGQAVDFNGSESLAGDREIVRYFWDFGDGGRARGESAVHTYQTPGDYRVVLRVEDGSLPPCNFGLDSADIRVNAAPVAEAGVDLQVSADEQFTLDGGRSYDLDGAIVAHSWDLGDGTLADGPVVRHAFAVPGSYDVELTVRDDSGAANDSNSDRLRVLVNEPPVAVAGAERQVAIGEVISFDAGDSEDPDGSIFEYHWDFGDGGVGRGPQVDYAYGGPGSYVVQLTVRDNSKTASERHQDRLHVTVNRPPTAVAGPDQLVTSSVVEFDGTGSSDLDGTIDSYLWDFGDGNTGTGASPRHVYQSPGTYRVRLTVTDDSGTIRNQHHDAMTVVVNAAPIADAGVDQLAAPGVNLSFIGTGSIDPDGEIASYTWDFGDGASASGPRVSHAYQKPGTYTVRLTVRDDTGHAQALDYDEAQVVINAQPVAEAGPDALVAPGRSVTLSAAGSFDPDGQIVSYRWNFSDSDEVIEALEATRTFESPGVFEAQLTVVDDSGATNDVAQDQVTIRVNHSPVAIPGDDLISPESKITFDGSASTDPDGDSLTYLWDFGDGTSVKSGARVTHTYSEGGTYPVILTVDDGTGLPNARASGAKTVTINRAPVAVAGGHRTVCAGDIVVFDGSQSDDPEGGLLRYKWDFGDGTTAEGVNPTKTYKVGALYPVTLTVQDDSGLPGSSHADRVTVTVIESPIAAAGPDQTVCVNTEVRFDGSGSSDSDGVVNRFSWDFGNGSIGGGQRPSHIYDQPGTYRVVLTIEGDESGQCDNSDSDELTVRVLEAPVARIVGPDMIPLGVSVSFDGSASTGGTDEITSWQWDFGDGTTSEGPQATHSYAEAGQYLVSLTIGGEGAGASCSRVSTQRAVVVNLAPMADAGEDRLASVGKEIVFDGSNSSDADGAILSYLWDFGDGMTASGVEVRHRYWQSGSFPVTLTVTDNTELENNSATDEITVTVNDAPRPEIDVQNSACVGETVAFSGSGSSDSEGTIVGYEWDFGDGTTAVGAEASHSYDAPGRYPVILAVDDGAAVANSRSQTSKVLWVNRPPVAIAGRQGVLCPGATATFDGTASFDPDGEILRYVWDFGDGTTAEGATAEHLYATPGSYEVRLRVEDDSGSVCAFGEDVSELIVNAPPVADAGGDRESFLGGAHDAVLFDAGGSADPDGQPLTYVWDFGDGVVDSGATVLHRYDRAGSYDVRLTVSDGSGVPCGEASDELTVVVKPRP
jgi:PKD repeat protein